MITPEPRLSDRRSRDPNISSSPKKYRKNGSLLKGELRERTTCSEEMFATPFTAWLATRVKSGPPAATARVGADAGAGAGRCSVTAAPPTGRGDSKPRADSAARTQPETRTPPTNPATTSTTERPRRLDMVR